MHSVVIADDRPSARQGLRLLLSGSGEYEVVGEASDGTEAVERCEALRPELLITDLKMPSLSVIEAAARLKRRIPHIKIVILTAFDDCEDIYRAYHAGVDGYLMKDTDPEEILNVIGQVLGGRTAFRSARQADPADLGRDSHEAP